MPDRVGGSEAGYALPAAPAYRGYYKLASTGDAQDMHNAHAGQNYYRLAAHPVKQHFRGRLTSALPGESAVPLDVVL